MMGILTDNIGIILLNLIVYSLFAVGILYFKKKIGTANSFRLFIVVPIGLSFIFGIGILIAAMFLMKSP